MNRTSACLVALGLALSGCTDVNVTRVDPAEPHKAVGIRYSLPKPFIVAHQDKTTGEVKCEITYLPDEENTYALHVGGVMDSRKVNIQLDDNGLLRQIDFAANTTVVPAKLAEVGGTLVGTVEKARQDREAAKAKVIADAQLARDTAVSTLEAELATAEDALATAEAATRKAQYDQDVADDAFKANPSDKTLEAAAKLKAFEAAEARMTEQRARAKRDALASELNTLKAGPLEPTAIIPTAGTFTPATATAGTTPTVGTLAERAAAEKKQFATAAAPVLYAVLEGVDTKDRKKRLVQLRAVGVDDVRIFQGVIPPYPVDANDSRAPNPDQPPTQGVTLTPNSSTIKPAGPLKLTSSELLRGVDLNDPETRISVRPGGSTLNLDGTSPLPMGEFREFEIRLLPGTSPVSGPYELKLMVTPRSSGAATSVTVKFSVVP